MDSNIEQLLEKYWAAETSLEEEAELRKLVRQADVEGAMEGLKMLFGHFESEQEVTLGDDFDKAVLARLSEKPEAKVVTLSSYFRRYASIAAAILVLVVSSYIFMQQQSTYEQADTFDSPEAAYVAFKKQLLMVSVYMNKGNNSISELSNLGKVDNGLQGLSKMGKASIGMGPLSKMSFR